MALQAEEKKRFEQIAKELRLTIIDVMAWSGGAHVGGSLSIVEILTLLYFKYLNIEPKESQVGGSGQVHTFQGPYRGGLHTRPCQTRLF